MVCICAHIIWGTSKEDSGFVHPFFFWSYVSGPLGTGATGAKAPVNFEQWVPGTRPETECTYHKFSNEGYNCL